jgi:two-component system response regulator VanR
VAKILIAEDDKLTAKETAKWLAQKDGHTVEIVSDGAEALARLRLYEYDLVILDWKMPGQSGVDVCQQARGSGLKLPILMLTANAAIDHKQTGFNVGADDYLTKPFDLRELSLRVRALLRRPPDLLEDCFEVNGVRLDRQSRQVSKNGILVHLTPREYSLLELLMRHKNRSFTTEEIVEQAWSSESDVSRFAIKTVVSRLRAKLSENDEPSIIHNSPGHGYCVKD